MQIINLNENVEIPAQLFMSMLQCCESLADDLALAIEKESDPKTVEGMKSGGDTS
jgi:hypothetical protein